MPATATATVLSTVPSTTAIPLADVVPFQPRPFLSYREKIARARKQGATTLDALVAMTGLPRMTVSHFLAYEG